MCDTLQDGEAVNKQTQMENQIIQTLEKKLRDYETAVAEKETYQRKTEVGLGLLDSVKDKQTCVFNELIDVYDALTLKYEFVREQLKIFYEENDCFRFDVKQLSEKLYDLKFAVSSLNTVCSTLKDEIERQEKELACLTGTIHDLQVKEQQIELEITDRDQAIACVKKSIDEKCAQSTELEKKITVEKVKNDGLQCSKGEIKIENETIVSSLQSELVTIQDQFNETCTECVKYEQLFDCKQRDCEMQNEELIKLKKQITALQVECEKQRCQFAEEINFLKGQVKSSSIKLELNITVLHDVQMDNNQQVNKSQDNIKTIKGLKALEESLQREIKQTKQDHELAIQKLAAERIQRSNEAKFHDRKSMLKIQEKLELKQLYEDQVREIQRLKMYLAEVKPNDTQETFRGTLDTCLELLCEEDKIPVNDDIYQC
ncbi:Hypothetical protein CINCED_3A020447 [Cinara cedri]|uniref:Uncharacterized protein n=1 Tax=Cinara cedri TaxID=506608 RepID=A0A5E4MD57_9HEMI|nr:Hypothetical protein CINCED_3A020447 [Cinara cedri]